MTDRATADASRVGNGSAAAPADAWLRRQGRGRSWLRRLVPLVGLLLLTSCGSVLTQGTADVAGIAGAGVAGAVTKSAATAAGIGLGISAGANAALLSVERDVHGAEQDRIATAAGALRPGEVGPWQVVHDVPIEPNEHGLVTVTRDIGSADFACKEIVFSVEGKRGKETTRRFFTATVCRDGVHWKWATAEPAIPRWGALQ